MKILMIGDIFSKQGRNAVAKELPKLRERYNLDFVIANAENTTHGRGLCLKHYEELKSAGIDCFTMGNHTWDHKDIFELMKSHNDVIRPYNINKENNYSLYGLGSSIFVIKNKSIRVTNLLGLSVNMKGLQSNPFEALDEIIKFDESDIHLVDFHAETTSEKNALFMDFAGSVSVIVGTHTHVPTNDARILNHTAYQTDLGMTGPINSVIGADPVDPIARFRNPLKPFILKPSTAKYVFSSTLIEFDDETSHPISIRPIIIYEE
ncbi:TIGR00282 family metallophosphoesterase [Ureaplasma canigenitalium]|uniref:TIGR00282 family metallophosphoesterase n=1 Tax=Ureaplasma canigenitalium TaxID=42092 RepID=UPI0004E140BF|nr:TIGR00282 family metallophosphoesterase [Ureaplasma canigenitalium]